MNCLRCGGACCEEFQIPVGTVFPTRDDPVGLDIYRWVTFHATTSEFQLLFDCRCTKLINGQCSTYEDRPNVCREYVAGGPHCLATVRRRRNQFEYKRIREEGDPETIHE